MSTDDVAICDALTFARMLADLFEQTGGTVADLRREIEIVWLAATFAAADSLGEINMKLLERRVSVSGGVELTAELEQARTNLVRVEAEAATAVGNARAEVTKAQSRVDAFRRGLVAEHAQAWRQHAERLRAQAEDAGDETVVVPVVRFGGPDGAVEAPELRYRRVVLAEAAVAADGRADWLDGYLLRGDALAGESLETLAGQLDKLPEAAETAAA